MLGHSSRVLHALAFLTSETEMSALLRADAASQSARTFLSSGDGKLHQNSVVLLLVLSAARRDSNGIPALCKRGSSGSPGRSLSCDCRPVASLEGLTDIFSSLPREGATAAWTFREGQHKRISSGISFTPRNHTPEIELLLRDSLTRHRCNTG